MVERVCAFVVVVKNRDAFAPTNPAFKEWAAALEKEVNATEGTGSSAVGEVLRLVPVSEVGPDDGITPSMIICTIKHDGRHKCRLVACGNRQLVQY